MARFTMEKIININTLEHRDTGLLIATSPDLKGLYVHGRTREELNRRIPQVIRDLLEASGLKVDRVLPLIDEPEAPGFVQAPHRFQAVAA